MSDETTPQLRVIALGGGVQSTAMALMAAEGDFGPVPDCAIFADTGWEPKQVYANVAWLAGQLPFPIHFARHEGKTLLEACEASEQANGYPGCPPPVFIDTPEGQGMGWRQCTGDWKVKPIKRKLRALLGAGVRNRLKPGIVEQWMGISSDEAHRMKPAREQWIDVRYPLVDAGLSRGACRAWFAERFPGRPLAKSACVGCPYHSAREWVAAKQADPEMWERTVALDRRIRDISQRHPDAGLTSGDVFLHRRMVPLDEAVEADEKLLASRPLLFDTGEGWGNECGGHCGV